MKTIYHYYAMHLPEGGRSIHLDGIVTAESPIETPDGFWAFRCSIARTHGIDPQKLTICSLTIIATKP